MSIGSKDVRSGIYRHYKGPLYLVLGMGHDANDAERTVVIYIGLQLDQAKAGPRLAVRTYEDFVAYVELPHGRVPRFEYIGSEFLPGMTDEEYAEVEQLVERLEADS